MAGKRQQTIAAEVKDIVSLQMGRSIFKLNTTEGFVFKTIIELFQASFSQIVFKITKEGIQCKMITTQGTMLFDLYLLADNFNEFYLDCEELFFGVNTYHLYKITSSIKKKDTFKMEITDERPNKLNIFIIPKEMDYKDGGFVSIEKVQNINIETPEGYEGCIQAPYGKFSKMWKELLGISKEICVQGNSKRIEFRSVIDGVLGRGTEYQLPDAEDNNEYREIFQADELNKLNKLSGFGRPVRFHVKKGLPLKIKVDAGSLGKLNIYICKE